MGVAIEKLDGGGYEVRVGCTRFFFLTRQAMMTELNVYLEDPQAAEKQYIMFQSRWLKYEEPARTGTVEPPEPPMQTRIREPITGIRIPGEASERNAAQAEEPRHPPERVRSVVGGVIVDPGDYHTA